MENNKERGIIIIGSGSIGLNARIHEIIKDKNVKFEVIDSDNLDKIKLLNLSKDKTVKHIELPIIDYPAISDYPIKHKSKYHK